MPDIVAKQSFGIGTTSSAWANRLSEYLRERVKLTQEVARAGAANSPAAGRTTMAHAESLNSVIAYLSKVTVDDAIHLLGYRIFMARGLMGKQYTPSPLAGKVFAAVGKEHNLSAEQTLVAWAAAEVEDLHRAYSGFKTEAEFARREADQARLESAKAEDQRARIARTLQSTEQELARKDSELAQAKRQLRHAAELLEAGGTTAEASPAEPEDGDNFPSIAQLEATLEKRYVNVGEYLYLERRGAGTEREPWYVAKLKNGTFEPIGPVSSGMTIKQAVEARERFLSNEKVAV